MENKRSVPPRWFLLFLLPPLFLASLFFIRGNDIHRRVPILSSTIASSTCHTANPSLPVFKTFPYGVIEDGATGIAFFKSSNTFAECTMSFLNGSWHSHAHLSASTSSTTPIVVELDGSQQPHPGKIIVGGEIASSVTKLEVALPNGSKAQVPVHDDLFYAWISIPASPNAAPTLLGFNYRGKVVDSVPLATISSSST
jgi:hypothetical protein